MVDETVTAADPYAALATLIERQLALVAERDFDGVAAVSRERAALVAGLPSRPPAHARESLTRCDLLHKRVTIELERVRESILLELRGVRHAQLAAAGYRPALPRTPRITACA